MYCFDRPNFLARPVLLNAFANLASITGLMISPEKLLLTKTLPFNVGAEVSLIVLRMVDKVV